MRAISDWEHSHHHHLRGWGVQVCRLHRDNNRPFREIFRSTFTPVLQGRKADIEELKPMRYLDALLSAWCFGLAGLQVGAGLELAKLAS